MVAVDSSQAYSEEKTEPFSQSEIDSRLRRRNLPVVNWLDDPEAPAIHLDFLRVEDHHLEAGVRLLVRPLVWTPSISPGYENCKWLPFHTDVESQDERQHSALAVTQSSKDVKFPLRIQPKQSAHGPHRPHLWCELYYDPASDNQILYNRSDVPITLSRQSALPEDDAHLTYVANPGDTQRLAPGTWRICITDIPLLDFRILEKRASLLLSPKPSANTELIASPQTFPNGLNSSGKRPSTDEGPPRSEKKARIGEDIGEEDQEGVIMYLALPPTSKEVVKAKGQALVAIENGGTVHVPGTNDLEEYQVTKRDDIAANMQSAVYTAEHSHLPNQVVTVKVLKTRLPSPNMKPQEAERNVIQQANMWLREYQSQDDLQHDSIVKLYGGDARHLALFMEHVEARDLSAREVWRNKGDDLFSGTKSDASRILHDISKALHYIHNRNLVHNDIKPSNILYSTERGAALCDFGLSTNKKAPLSTGGTPYYVPPEFIGSKLRGTPSDVWALGITMLYVLGKIPYPDARATRAHPKRLYWMIAEVNRPLATGRGMQGSASAVLAMRTWLGEIDEARKRLSPHDKMERLVKAMLVPHPNQRITVAEVLRELYAEEPEEVA
ncbi:related to protein kinase [Cephalotrichum gorgonifer]|uniref:Related to protein kinase n=1 Tax=Cephalotrichum gorgonifer TaxID=2041049 RepID=A0AAE8N072_9PEZI|nr:related to protein kinase [Cephalotrichum gorgonifer]